MSVPPYDVSKLRLQYRDPEQLRQALVFLAQQSEKSERFEDVCRFMKAVIQLVPSTASKDLSPTERHLFSVGFKRVVGGLRNAWKQTRPEEQKFEELVEDFRNQIERELASVCVEVITLLEGSLLKLVEKVESKVFVLKTSVHEASRFQSNPSLRCCIQNWRLLPISRRNATQQRMFVFLCDYTQRRFTHISFIMCADEKKAIEYYNTAWRFASSMSATHPTRLGLALNYSVCLHEVIRDRKSACDLAKSAFDGSIAKLDELDEASYKVCLHQPGRPL